RRRRCDARRRRRALAQRVGRRGRPSGRDLGRSVGSAPSLRRLGAWPSSGFFFFFLGRFGASSGAAALAGFADLAGFSDWAGFADLAEVLAGLSLVFSFFLGAWSRSRVFAFRSRRLRPPPASTARITETGAAM